MKTCSEGSLSTWRVLSPALGQLDVGTPASYGNKGCESYRRGQYEHNLDCNTNCHAHNSDTRRDNDNSNRSGSHNNRSNRDHSHHHPGNNGCHSNNGRRNNNGCSYENGASRPRHHLQP